MIVTILSHFKLFPTSLCTHPEILRRFLFWSLTFRAANAISFLESLSRINLVTTCYFTDRHAERNRESEKRRKRGEEKRGEERRGEEED